MKCEYCGKEFQGRKRKYCDSKCRESADKENKRNKYTGKRQEFCIQCGCELPKFKTKFCSHRCELINRGIILDHGLLEKECPICGKSFTTYKARQNTCGGKDCQYENKRQRDKKRYIENHPDYISQEERQKLSLVHKKQAQKEKAIKAVEREKEKAIKAKERQKILVQREKIKQANIAYWQQYEKEHTCVICNKKYTAHHPFSKYCSKKCERKTHPKDRKRLKGKIVDKDITLIKVAKKYNNICQICGLKVEWTDKQCINGTTICGEYYPSIDHIQPLSKGGLHCWDNVWLAHRKCNSYKSDKIMY